LIFSNHQKRLTKPIFKKTQKEQEKEVCIEEIEKNLIEFIHTPK